MKMLNEMPTEGKFVIVWTRCGGIWSQEYRWADGELLEYEDDNGWMEASIAFLKDCQNVTYITGE